MTFGEKTALPLGLSVYNILLEFSHAYTATVTGGRKILKIDKERVARQRIDRGSFQFCSVIHKRY